MSDEIGVTEDELLRFASTLDKSLQGLVQPTETERPPVNAGRATAAVAEVFGMYYSALAGIATGVERTAKDITLSRTRYVADDDAAAAGLPPLPLDTSSGGPLPLPIPTTETGGN